MRRASCPEPAPARRLNRYQYTATIRDLLNVHVDIGATLPADSAGGEGFDNAAETLFLSPIYAEKYLDAAKLALDYASKDPRARAKFLIAAAGTGSYPRGRRRARFWRSFCRGHFAVRWRRPMSISTSACSRPRRSAANPFEESILYAIRAALISPQFLFRTEPPNTTGQTRAAGRLFARLAALVFSLGQRRRTVCCSRWRRTGKLSDPEILQGQVARMLRNQKSVDFARSFVDQWLRHPRPGPGVQARSEAVSGVEGLGTAGRHQESAGPVFPGNPGQRSFAAGPDRFQVDDRHQEAAEGAVQHECETGAAE